LPAKATHSFNIYWKESDSNLASLFIGNPKENEDYTYETDKNSETEIP